MSELTNQECRDLKGSLSDRGCYFDRKGKPTEHQHGSVTCSCLDCGRRKSTDQVFHVKEYIKGREVVRPICAACNVIREAT